MSRPRRCRELAGYTAHGSGSVVSKGLSVGDFYADAEQWEETRSAKSGRQELGEDAAQESLGNLPECKLYPHLSPLPTPHSQDQFGLPLAGHRVWPELQLCSSSDLQFLAQA